MFKEISDLLNNLLKPENSTVKMMNLRTGINEKMFTYLSLKNPEYFREYKNILRYDEKEINNRKYCVILVESLPVICYTDIFLNEGTITYMIAIDKNITYNVKSNIDTVLSIFDKACKFFLDGITGNTNYDNKSLSCLSYGIKYSYSVAYEVLFINTIMVTLGLYNIDIDDKWFDYLKNKFGFSKPNVIKYMDMLTSIDIYDLLDNNYIIYLYNELLEDKL